MRFLKITAVALAFKTGSVFSLDDEFHQPSSKLSWSTADENREHHHRLQQRHLQRRLIVEKGVNINPKYDEDRKLIDLKQDLHPKELRKLVERVETKQEGRAQKEASLSELDKDDLSYWQRFLQTSGSLETQPPVASPTTSPTGLLAPTADRTTPPSPSGGESQVPRTEMPSVTRTGVPSVTRTAAPTPGGSETEVPRTGVPSFAQSDIPSDLPSLLPTTDSGMPFASPTEITGTPFASPSLTGSASPSGGSLPTVIPPSGDIVPTVSASPTGAVVPPTPPIGTPTISTPTLSPVLVVVPTTPPALERCREVIVPVALFSGDEFVDPESYQSKALDWLCGPESTAYLADDVKLIQRYSLACIYYATYNVSTAFTDALLGNGTVLPWNVARDWLSATDECTWSNTLCDQTTTGSVVRLDFFANFMSGEFPPEVTYLKGTLSNIDLGRNPVFTRGEVFNTWLGTLTQLTSLRYEDTNFINDNGIPTEIGLLTNLEFYECTNVRYVGAISSLAFPATLTRLAYIEMEYNTFDSPIPTEIGLLPSLEFFYARGSSITGNIDFMQNAVKMRECWTDDNPGITGTLPTFWATLTNLGGLSVTNCNWSGPLPTELGLLSANLQQLFFYGNSLTGGIPLEYAGLTALTQLRVEDNLLTTTIPTEVCLLKITGGLNLQADCEVCPFNCCTNC